jgi:hypothetical protein
MITLPAKFAAENDKAQSDPTVLVKIGESTLENVQTTQGDWTANSAESQVDYTTSPGDVIIESETVPTEENLSNNAILTVRVANGVTWTTVNDPWQSFKHTTGDSKKLSSIKIKMSCDNLTGSPTVRARVYNGRFGTLLGNGSTESLTSTSATVYTSDFSGVNITLEHNTEYWIRIDHFVSNSTTNTLYAHYQNTDVYADGQLDWYSNQTLTWTEDIGDAYFVVTMTGDYYKSTGNITTQIIDLGEIPTDDGEWLIEDVTTDGTITYAAWGSTDNFVASNVSIGAIVDGGTITGGDLYRYYKIQGTLSGTNQSFTPILQSMGLSFVTYINVSDIKGTLGYEPSLKAISSLQLTLGQTDQLVNYLNDNYPKNKPVRVLLGYNASGFTESDYVLFYSGVISEYSMKSDIISMSVKDNSASWKVQIPVDESTAGNQSAGTFTNIVASADHHIDVILDILQTHLSVRDSKIDFGAFEAVKTALSGWEVTRTITGDDQQSGDDLLNELRFLISCYYIPQPDGKVTIKQYDRDEAVIDSITENDIIGRPSWEANLDRLANKTFIEYNYNTGTEVYDNVYIGIDLTSQSNFDETKSFLYEDLWTEGDAQGISQMDTLTDNIITRYADPPPIFKVKLDRKKIAWEVGDMVSVTTLQAPGTDMSGVTAEKYQIIKKNFNPLEKRIAFEMLKVVPTP